MADKPQKRVVDSGALQKTIDSKNVPLSAVVTDGTYVYVSGLPPFDSETQSIVGGSIEDQTEQVLKNLKFALESAGSSLDKVLKTTVYITNSAYFARFNNVYRKYFPTDPPARTFVPIASFPLEFDIEIECMALL